MTNTTTNRTFREDNHFGLQSEEQVLTTLQTKVHPNFKKLDKYCQMDFMLNMRKCVKYLVELKSRNIKKTMYETTLMPFSKLHFIRLHPKFKGVFLFSFEDGLYGCFTDDLVEGDNYTVDNFQRNPITDFDDKLKKYLFIKTTFLTPFDEMIFA